MVNTTSPVQGVKDRPITQVSLRDFEARKPEIAKDLWRAATEIGFFYLCDTVITEVSDPAAGQADFLRKS